jgi:hypothetical protein
MEKVLVDERVLCELVNGAPADSQLELERQRASERGNCGGGRSVSNEE